MGGIGPDNAECGGRVMGDRWMDERDRQLREGAWRRAEDPGPGDGHARDPRWGEDRTWAEGEPQIDDELYRRPARGYAADERTYGGMSELTRGGAYARDPMGGRVRYPNDASRFSRQDAAGPARGRPAYGRDDDWRSAREDGWARFNPEGDDWRDRHDAGRHDRPGDFLSRAGERITSWFRGDNLMRGSREAEDDRPRRYQEDFGREARPIPQASHRGRGPRGYRRSDERINDEAHDRLTDDPWLDASEIRIEVKDAEVTLSGLVDNREAKHRAERLIEDISGVTHVQNNLRVNPDAGLTGAGHGYGSGALEAEMRRRAWETDPANNGASGPSGRTSTGAAAERSSDDPSRM
jgi:hypothetical protein